MTIKESFAAVRRIAPLGVLVLIAGCETARHAQRDVVGDPIADSTASMTTNAPESSQEAAQAAARARFERVLDGYAEREADRIARVGTEVNDEFHRLPDDLKALVNHKIEKKLRGGPTTGAAEAAAYFMDQRVPEGVAYPIGRLKEIANAEVEQAQRIVASRAQHGLVRGAATDDFGVAHDLRGSDPFIDGWRALGPGNIGGRTRAMVISPDGPGTGDEGDEGFMLAAGVAGGVFKSTDGGASWRPTSDPLDNIAVCSLAMDPTDPNIVYAGTGEGYSNGDAVRGLGVFKSEDGGESWRQLEETIEPLVSPFAFQYVNKIAVSPIDPLRIYAATRSGVWIHRNAGEPENQAGDSFQWELKLANPFYLFGPANSQGSSVGATDLQVRPAPRNGSGGMVEDEFVLAAFGSFIDDGLYASPDGGDSWFRIIDETASAEDPFKIDTAAQGRMSIAFSRRSTMGDAGLVYVMMAKNQSFLPNDPDSPDPDITAANEIPFGAVFGVYRADLADLEIERDVNDNIVGIALPFERRLNDAPSATPLNRMLLSNALANNICGSSINLRINQGWYDNIIKVDPSNRNVVWAGGVDLYRSDDGGRNFGLASYWYFDIDEEQYVHADQHEIVFHPDYDGASNTTMFVTNDGGIFQTTDALAPTINNGCPFPDSDTGEEFVSSMIFESLNNGYEVTQFYHGETGDSITGGRDLYVGGAQDNGTIRTLQRRCTEDWTELLGGDGGYVAVDPTNNDLIYVETQRFGNIYRVQNSPGFGEGPRFISDRLRGRDTGLFITPFAMDPNNPGTIWTGGTRPWRTTDADSSVTELINWTPGPNLNAPGVPPMFDIIGTISAIAVAPSDSRVVYVGTEDGYIARTSNATSNAPQWTVLTNGLPLETGYISGLAVDPDDADVVWATNARFTGLDPNNPSPDANLYRGECSGDCDDPASWFFASMDGTDCDFDDEVIPLLPDVPAHWVSIRRCDSGGCGSGNCLVFVGTEIGVYVSDDAYDIDTDCDPDGDGPQPASDAITWQMLNIGDNPSIGIMPTTVVESLDFRDDNTIVAFTHGRGAFLANILRECNGVAESEPCSPADLVAPFGVIDQADITAWIEDTAQGRLSADMPPIGEECGNGVLDLFDINRFVDLFSAGCP